MFIRLGFSASDTRQDLLILHVYDHVGMSILVHSFVQPNDLRR